MTSVEYSLSLSTGERVDVSEYDYERTPAVLSLPEDVLEGCSMLAREDVESAKRGYDFVLRNSMRDPLSGMLKMRDPVCALIRECAMADRKVCTSKNVRGRKKLPVCWEHASEDLDVRAVVSSIVLAWAAGRRVILVVPAERARRPARG